MAMDEINTTVTEGIGVNNTLDPLCYLNTMCVPTDDYVDLLYEDIFPKKGHWVLVAIYIIAFLAGLFGNILVIFAIWRNKNMRTVTNIFIVNLAVADIAVIVVVLPCTAIVDISLTWWFGRALCKVFIFMSTLSVTVSVLTLTAISVERWYAICHPLRFHSTVRRARYIIIIIWVICTCVAIPELIFADVLEAFEYTVVYSACYPKNIDPKHVVVQQMCLMAAFYFVPLLLMGFAYINIGLVLWNGHIPGEALDHSVSTRRRHATKDFIRRLAQRRAQVIEMRRFRQSLSDSEENEMRGRQPMLNRSNTNAEDQSVSRRKAAKMLFTIVILFAICFFPNHLLNLLRYTESLPTDFDPRIFALIAHLLACTNSCINPLIYNFMSDKFRKEFRQSISVCLRCGKYNRGSQSFRRNDTYKVTFTSTPTQSCKLSYSPPIKKAFNGSTRMTTFSTTERVKNSMT